MTYQEAVNHIADVLTNFDTGYVPDVLSAVADAIANHADTRTDCADLYVASRVLRGLAQVKR